MTQKLKEIQRARATREHRTKPTAWHRSGHRSW